MSSMTGEQEKRYKCRMPDCSNTYGHKRSLTHHMRQAHQCFEVSQDRLRVTCLEDDCFEKFITTEDLVRHLELVHGKKMERCHQRFDKQEDFNVWKSDIERETAARFVAKRSWYKKDGSIGRVYNCNRSGTYRPTVADDKRKRKIKAQGTRKIGQLCPARILVHEYASGIIEAVAMITHYGHECQLHHISFSKEERAFIQGNLAMGMSPERIINDIRASVATDDGDGKILQRIALANNKDLCNMLYSMKREMEAGKSHIQLTVDNDYCPLSPLDVEDMGMSSPKNPGVLQVEVLQESSYDEVMPQQVKNLCSTLHGCLLTHQLDQTSLMEIQNKLRECIAIAQVHGKRHLIPENLTAISLHKTKRGRPRKRKASADNMAADKEIQVITSAGVVDSNGEELSQIYQYDDTPVYTISANELQRTDVVDDGFENACDHLPTFIKKVCNPRGLKLAESGELIDAEGLNLSENSSQCDSSILEFDVAPLAHWFDYKAYEKISDFIYRERENWKCAACQKSNLNVTNFRMVQCNKCPRWYHFACVGLEEDPETWSCSFCL